MECPRFRRHVSVADACTTVGRRDFVANGALFGVYHRHQPWSMPASVVDGIVNQAYPTKRFQSTWMGLITHTAPSILIIGVVLSLVLKECERRPSAENYEWHEVKSPPARRAGGESERGRTS